MNSSNKTVADKADQIENGAQDAIRATQAIANDTLDRLSDQVSEVRSHVAPVIGRVAGEAEELAQRGIGAVRDGSGKLRDSAARASDRTIAYIRDEPVKAVLVAAAAGAALVTLASLFGRARSQRS